jgi:uncharacterized protein YbjT (DUF2867 family)
MRVLLTGATGMLGQGALLECLRDPGVEGVVTLGRSATGNRDPRLEEITVPNLADLHGIADRVRGLDACFFCLGISSAGMSEAEYTRVTYDLTLAVAETLSRLNPGMTFIYVSGAGTDSTERGRSMWARVKGRTENALLALPLNAYMFRPGLIVPLDGIRSKTRLYRLSYAILKPVLPLLRRMMPNQVVTTREMGHAMLAVAKRGYAKRILETADIRAALRG